MKRKFDFSYIFLLAILFLINIRYFSEFIWPQHDSFGCFEVFYFFYNDFFLHGELPKWIPFGTYGATSMLWQVSSLTPASYFMIMIGKIFAIRDVLLLFKFSILIEQIMLLSGTYLLSKKLYKNQTTVIFVSLCVMASTVWITQLFLNFRIYYLLPLVFYFIVDFIETKRISFFLKSLIVYIVSLIGNGTYSAALHIMIFLVMIAVLLWNYPGFFKTHFVVEWKKNLPLLAVLAILCAAYVYPFWDTAQNLVSYAPGRDSKKFDVSVDDFVTYGFHTDLAKYLGFMYPDSGTIKTLSKHPDQTLYLGLLPFLFLLYGIRNVRHVWFWVFGVISLVLFAFSLADTSFVARFTYHFSPLMNLYRHVGFVGGILRLFLILTAGFGLDQYLLDVQNNDTLSLAGFKPRRVLLGCGVALIVLMLVLDLVVNAGNKLYAETWPSFFGYGVAVFALATAILSSRPGKSVKTIQVVSILFLMLDLLSYQNLLYASMPKVEAIDTRTVAAVHRYDFQPIRSNQILASDARQQNTLLMSVNDQLRIHGSVYFSSFSFAQMDACSSRIFRVDFISKPIDHFLRSSNAALPSDDTQETELAKSMGCRSPKLRLSSSLESGAPENLGSIKVGSFSANELRLTADVANSGGAWLVYLDSSHPDWRASVDGRIVPIKASNTAFKAVRLKQGSSRVRFWITSWQSTLSSTVLMLSGLIFAAGCLMVTAFLIFQKPKSENNIS